MSTSPPTAHLTINVSQVTHHFCTLLKFYSSEAYKGTAHVLTPCFVRHNRQQCLSMVRSGLVTPVSVATVLPVVPIPVRQY